MKLHPHSFRFSENIPRQHHPIMATKGSSRQLKSLTTKLRGLRTSFSNIRRFVSEYKEGTVASQINVRIDRLNELWESINQTAWEIESHEDFEDNEAFHKEQEEFESRFYDVKAFLIDKAHELQEIPTQEHTTSGGDAT